MKKVILIAGIVLMASPVLGTDSVNQIGSISHPDGSVTAVYEARTDRLMHHEEAKLLAYRTASEKGENGKYSPKTKLESDPAAVGGMAWLGQGAAGFVGNLPNAGGLIGGAALLRPSSTNVSQSGGGAGSAVGDGSVGGLNGAGSTVGKGATGAGTGAGGLTVNNSASAAASASAKASARQSQFQGQSQFQSQNQVQSQINKGGKTIIHNNNGLHLGEGHGTGNPH